MVGRPLSHRWLNYESMPLSRKLRLTRLDEVLAVMSGSEWSLDRINLVLRTFDLEAFDYDKFSPSLAELLAEASDAVVNEIYETVTGKDVTEDSSESGCEAEGNWRPGFFRLFLSHSAKHKAFVGQVGDLLEPYGIQGFVAHDSMRPSLSWQAQIEHALRTMDAFAGIVHPEFNDSAWCQEEVGWALGRNVPRFFLRMGADPAGFVQREQWPSFLSRNEKEIAGSLAQWVVKLPSFGVKVFDHLVAAIRDATSYERAAEAGRRLNQIEHLTETQFRQLGEAILGNRQAYESFTLEKEMKRLYERNRQTWPGTCQGFWDHWVSWTLWWRV
jgi:hypothetical protein